MFQKAIRLSDKEVDYSTPHTGNRQPGGPSLSFCTKYASYAMRSFFVPTSRRIGPATLGTLESELDVKG